MLLSLPPTMNLMGARKCNEWNVVDPRFTELQCLSYITGFSFYSGPFAGEFLDYESVQELISKNLGIF